MNKQITLALAVFGILLSLTDKAMALPPLHVPDVGSTSLLLGISFLGLAGARMFFSKKK